jgi:hypothetical protein
MAQHRAFAPQVLLRAEESGGAVAIVNAPARCLVVITPAGFERYFDRIAAEAAGVEPPAGALEPYPETIVVGPAIPADRR